MSEQTEQFLGSLSTVDAHRAAEAQKSKLRTEYLAIVQSADPSRAARLRELADGLGISTDTIKQDLAHFHPATPAAPAAPAVPAPDLSKMNGMDLLRFAMAQQKPADFDGTNLPDVSKMNYMQLLKLGDSLRAPLHPDGTSPKPAA